MAYFPIHESNNILSAAKQPGIGCQSSLEWRRYFEDNARHLFEIPWHLGAELTREETAAIAQSLKEFQAGESSEGKHLSHSSQRYAERTGDREYVVAIRFFIAEEQRHARDLGRSSRSTVFPS
jgi:hypothetical protein